MHAAYRWSRWSVVSLFLVGTATGCSRERSEGMPPQSAGKIPITTSSEAARQEYLTGRTLAENLKAYDSRQHFEKAIEGDSTFALAYYNLALNSATAKGFFDNLHRAVALADRVSEGERLMILGLQAGANADPQTQTTYLEQLVAKYPQDERAHFLLGGSYAGRQHYAKAVDEYQKTVAIAPDFPPVYNSLGYNYRPTGNYAEAEKAFKKYIELIPGDPNPYDSYAELLMKTGRFEESIDMYRKALAIDPHFFNSYIGIAADFMYLGKHDSAVAETGRLLDGARSDGERRAAMFTNTVVYADQGKFDLALKELEKQYAMGAQIGDTAAMSGDAFSMGEILLEAGKTAESLRRYDQSRDLLLASSLSQDIKDNATLNHHFNLGRVALRRNDLATAKSEADAFMTGATAKQNDFQIRQAHELQGMIALQEKDYDKALAELGQANQQNGYNLYRMGLAYAGKRDTGKQQEMFSKAANLNNLPTLNAAFVRTKAQKQANTA